MTRDDRPISAPPVDRLVSDVPFTVDDLKYSSYFRLNSRIDPRLPVPNFFTEGQGSIFYGYIREAAKRKTVVEMIDEDYPQSKTIECTETSRASSPVVGNRDNGNRLLLDLLTFSRKLNPFSSPGDGLCFDLSKDQDGSRYIQWRLENASEREVLWFVDQIRGRLYDLCVDLFGNYIVQRLIGLSFGARAGDQLGGAAGAQPVAEQPRHVIYRSICDRLYSLSFNIYGCRVVQKLLDNVDVDVSFIKGHVLDLIQDQNGNHVVQKCIEYGRGVDLILNEFEENPILVAKHKYGCRAVQRLFEFGLTNSDKKRRERLCGVVRSILSDESMIIDQYGNYVVQHVMEYGSQDDRDAVFEMCLGSFYDMSVHKFASNVMERIVLMCSDEQRSVIISKLMPNIYNLCMNNYGNYVVQRILETCGQRWKSKIKECLRSKMSDLKASVFAKQIVNKLM